MHHANEGEWTAPHPPVPGANNTYGTQGCGAERAPGSLCASCGSVGPLPAEGGWNQKSCMMQTMP